MRSHLVGKVRHRRSRPDALRARARRLLLRARPGRARPGDRSRAGSSAATGARSCRFATPTTCRRRRPTWRATSARHLASEGIDLDGGRITLVTGLRVFGYVFNPASFFLCRDAAGALAAVVCRGAQHLPRAAPVHAPARATPTVAFSAADGQGLLRLTLHQPRRPLPRHGARRTAVAWHRHQPAPGRASRCSRPACAAAAAADDAQHAAAHAAPSVDDPEHDRAHPLARPAAVAQARALPAPRAARPLGQRRTMPVDERASPGAGRGSLAATG